MHLILTNDDFLDYLYFISERDMMLEYVLCIMYISIGNNINLDNKYEGEVYLPVENHNTTLKIKLDYPELLRHAKFVWDSIICKN